MATERQFRQALARSLDDLLVSLVLSISTNTLTLNHWATGLANASARRFDARWIHVKSSAAASVQKAILPGSYNPTNGTVLPFSSSGWDTTPQLNDEVEITSLFPSIPCDHPGGEDVDYRTILNRALGRLLIEDRLDVTTVADQYSYPLSLATYPWLDRTSRVVGVLDPPRAVGLPRRETWRRVQWKMDAGAMTLEFLDRPYPTSGAIFQVAVLRPANTLINSTDSTVGLATPTDTAVPSIEEVVTVGRMFAFEALLTRSKGQPSGDWSSQYAAAREDAMKLARYDRTLDATPTPAAAGVGAA